MTRIPDDFSRLSPARSVPWGGLAERSHLPAFLSSTPSAPAPARDGLAETLGKLWRRRYLIAACVVVFGGSSTLIAWLMPSYYTAEARILVGVPAPRVLTSEAVITDASPDAERVQSEGFILQSRILAKRVIDQLKLATNPNFNTALREAPPWFRWLDPAALLPAAARDWIARQSARPTVQQVAVDAGLTPLENRMIDILLSRVDVSLLGRSHVLSVKAEAREPTLAATIANTIASTYLDYQRGEKVATLDRVDKFLLGRVNELREQVSASEQAVEDYRRKYGLYKGSGTGPGVTAQQLTELNTQLLAAQTAKAEIDSRLSEALEMRKGGLGRESVPDVLRSALIVSLKQQLADADRKAAEANAMYGDRNPAWRSANAEAAAAQSRVNAEIAKTVDGIAREARAADVRYQTLNQEFENLKERMGAVNDRAIGLDALERDAMVNRNLLEAMLNRVKQSTGADVIAQANAKLISPASAPEAPSSPPRSLIAALGILAGLMFGSAIGLLRQGADSTFRRADEVEATTGFPLLAMVPETNTRTSPSLQVMRDPASTFGEALRRMQVGIDLSAAAASPTTLLFSSATPSEGKTVMVASLGRMLASTGRRTLLIDCDWRRPGLHEAFRCTNGHGLAGLLTTNSEVLPGLIHHDAVSGCDVLTAGNWLPRQAHLLGSERMRQLIDALTPHYHSIILDTAPTLVAVDALSLSRFVQRVVFVVRWDHTRKDAVLEGLKQITDAQGQVAGVVLTRVEGKKYRQYGQRPPFYEYARPLDASATTGT